MLNHHLAFLAIIEVSALGVFGTVCLILACFGLPAELIYQAYKKRNKKVDKDGKRIPPRNELSHWDYLVIILPICLLLISLLTVDGDEQKLCLLILGLGVSAYILVLSNRIEFVRGQYLIFYSSLIPALFALFFKLFYKSFMNIAEINLLFMPIISFVYLIIARYVIKIITGRYPVNVDRGNPVGTMHYRYNRRSNYWDLIWSIFNALVLVGLPFLLLEAI